MSHLDNPEGPNVQTRLMDALIKVIREELSAAPILARKMVKEISPILDEACHEAYKRGSQEGFQTGFKGGEEDARSRAASRPGFGDMGG